MYKASIIIPVYNAEKTLRKCVESLIYGQERNIEIILIEDCSGDYSWLLCEELSEEYQNVFCYKNENNRGVSYSRNKGLEYVSAPYVLFVDSDDWVSSKYVQNLLEGALNNKQSLPVCGYTYLDYINESRNDYEFQENSCKYLAMNEAFTLLDRILLQQLWNKIFCVEIIQENNIRFDESLSMGEDFKFVLDYLQASRYVNFFLIKERLYYYIRADRNSLMSGWSLQSVNDAIEQYEKLYQICNDDSDKIKTILEEHKERLRYNFAYHIIRNRNISYKEQKKQLKQLLTTSQINVFCRKQYLIKQKECVVDLNKKMKSFFKRIDNRLVREKNKILISKAKQQLKENDFTIISQNCIGGVLYHDMGMEFLSPTINTFISAPDFIKLVQQLKYYLEMDIEMFWGEEYPIGLLQDVEIHFAHYNSCKEAKDSWERRKKRVNWDKIVVLATDRDGFVKETYNLWKVIPYPKILYTVNYNYKEDAVLIEDVNNQGYIGSLIPKRLFYKNGTLISKLNDLKK